MAFDVDVTLRRGARAVRAAFVAGPGITALFGPSGAGKTSVLDMVAGLLRPDAGHVRFGETVLTDTASRTFVAPEARGCGYVFQDLRLFPHLTVRDNLAYGWRSEARFEPGEMAEFLGIAGLLDRRPRNLSGGEAQRVAIGRALLSNPRFLLLDEPLTALDAARRGEILGLIERVRDEFALPMLYVSHDRSEVERLADRIVAIEPG